MGLRDRLRNALVVLLDTDVKSIQPQPTQMTPTQSTTMQPSLSEADVRRLVAEFASRVDTRETQPVATTVAAKVDETAESNTESNIDAEVESNIVVTDESNSAAEVESNIIDPIVAKRRRGMIARIRRLRDTANYPPAGRRYYEYVKTFNDDGDEIEMRRDLEFVEESLASLCDLKTHPLHDTKWERERPSWFPDHYGVVDGVVVETAYVQRPNHLPTDHGWLSALRQDVPRDMLDRHDYYASFGMRCWLAPDGDRYAIVYWSPDPANWSDSSDRPVVGWPQPETVVIGPVSLSDVDALMSEAEGAPTVRQFAHRVGYIDQPFAGARSTWGRQSAPRVSTAKMPKKMEFVFNIDSERLSLDDIRRN